MYDFNQLLGKRTEERYEGSYKEIADYIRSHAGNDKSQAIKTNLEDIEILFKRILVSVLVGNWDNHLKNFSLLRNGAEFRLSPSYDITSGVQYKPLRKGPSVHTKNIEQQKVKSNKMALRIGPTDENRANDRINLPDMQPKHIIQLAQDFGLMSTCPTDEEKARLLLIVNRLGQQIHDIRPLWHDAPAAKAGLFSEAMRDPDQARLVDAIGITVERRWHATFRELERAVEIYQRRPPSTSHGPEVGRSVKLPGQGRNQPDPS